MDVSLGSGRLGVGPVGIAPENDNDGTGNPLVGNDPVGRGMVKVIPVGIGRREKVKPPVGIGNPPVGIGRREKVKLPVGIGNPPVGNRNERVGRGIPPVPGKENDGKENGPDGKPEKGAVPVGRGKEKLLVGKGGLEDTVGSVMKDVDATSDDEGMDKLGNVVAGVGKDTLPPGRVIGGKGRIGIEVGRVNGGAVLLVDSTRYH